MKLIDAVKASFQQPRMKMRMLLLFISITTMGVCVSFLKIVGMGTDPCSTFSFGLAKITGLSMGTCQMFFNMVMFIPVILYDLSKIGIGTFLNMVYIGYVVDFCLGIIRPMIPAAGLDPVTKYVIFAIALAIFIVAVAIYVVVNMGMAPYDAIPPIIADRVKKIPFRLIRMGWDFTVMFFGFLLGSEIGLTTILLGFCLGPVIEKVSAVLKPWIDGTGTAA